MGLSVQKAINQEVVPEKEKYLFGQWLYEEYAYSNVPQGFMATNYTVVDCAIAYPIFVKEKSAYLDKLQKQREQKREEELIASLAGLPQEGDYKPSRWRRFKMWWNNL